MVCAPWVEVPELAVGNEEASGLVFEFEVFVCVGVQVGVCEELYDQFEVTVVGKAVCDVC